MGRPYREGAERGALGLSLNGMFRQAVVAKGADVDAVMAQAVAAGASIVKPAHDTFWAVVWNPQWLA